MVQFLLQRENSPELSHFDHIHEFALKKINSISLNSFKPTHSEHLRFYYIVEGKFNWNINGVEHTLYPTDLAMILPGQELLAHKGYLEIGTLYWLNLQADNNSKGKKNQADSWNSIVPRESDSLRNILFCNHTPVILQLKEAGPIFNLLRNELFSQEVGYITRVYQLIDELLILISRKLTRQNISHRDFPKTFMKLEESLRKNLFHHWTVEEMATSVGLGTTAFSDKVKSYTGFTPMNYLINIRISEAIKLLKRPEVNMTDIALVTGFYSSQHFSTTFKKLTGYTPSQFRKNNNTKT